MQPHRILILSDGRPGHHNLSEGIAAAIERLGPATTERTDVRRGRWPGAVLAAMTRTHLPARSALAGVYGIDEAATPPCDIIVSAGAETLAASVWLARARGVPNIFYGSLRLFDAHDFSLVLTSYQRNADKPHHALALKPSRFDPDTAPPRASAITGGEKTLGVLIGGNTGGIEFAHADWDRLFALIGLSPANREIRWLVANSRRTPAEVSDRLERAARQPGTPIDQFLDVRSAGPGTLAALLARCDAVLCTADSSSMISECVWSQKPTITLRPEKCAFTADETDYRCWMEQSGWCRELSLRHATTATIETTLSHIRPLTTNPLADLAQLLRHRLPSLSN